MMGLFSFCKDVFVNADFKLNGHWTGMNLEAHANQFAALRYPIPLHLFQLLAMIKGHLIRTRLERTQGSMVLLGIHMDMWSV
jgi:hypothetical protein